MTVVGTALRPPFVCGISLFSLMFFSSYTKMTAVAKKTDTTRELEPGPASSVSGPLACGCCLI